MVLSVELFRLALLPNPRRPMDEENLCIIRFDGVVGIGDTPCPEATGFLFTKSRAIGVDSPDGGEGGACAGMSGTLIFL